LGAVFSEQSRYEEAIASYNAAITIKPQYAPSFYNLGIIFKTQNNLEEAIASYNAAITINPEYAEPRYNLVRV